MKLKSRMYSYYYTQSVRFHGRGIRPSQGLYLYTEQHKHRINAQTSMSRVGFEPTTSVLEQAKTVHVLDRAATVIGSLSDLPEYDIIVSTL
jgi:FAD synthase